MEKFSPKANTLNNKSINLQLATAEDGAAGIDFLTLISEETPFTYNYPGQQLKAENLASRYANEYSSPNNFRLLAKHDAKIIGLIGMWKINPDHPWLNHKAEFAMMVAKEWWGTGLAKELLKEAEIFAHKAGIKRIEATVNCINERGVALYKKFGYEIEGTARGYKIVNGKPLDSYYIAKLL